MKARAFALAVLSAVAAGTWSQRARAVDLPEVAGKPLKLDVTETAVVTQQFQARESEGEDPRDQGYGVWTNRLNGTLKYERFLVGARIDSSLYWLRPVDRSICAPNESGGCIPSSQYANYLRDSTSRFKNTVYPAKLFATYKEPGFEATVGDTYVQFGRGLILSMRKIDEFGTDTTLRGGRIVWQKDPVGVTLVGGFANPTRVDDATGRALYLPDEIIPNPARGIPGDPNGPQPLFGSDRLVGAQIQLGRGTPFIVSAHAVRLTRCAPYAYDTTGRVDTGTLGTPFGDCAPSNVQAWLDTLPSALNPLINASEVDMAAQSIELPNLLAIGGPQPAGGPSVKLYVEGAVQRWLVDKKPGDDNASGNAIYGNITADLGPVTNTFELKSYRNFWPLIGGVDLSRASAFSTVQYSTPPTTELLTQDSMFGNFNVCVDGGRLRTDVRVAPFLLVYGQGIYAHSKSEVPGGGCDANGHIRAPTGVRADDIQTNIVDGTSGIEWSFEHDHSHVFASVGVRQDDRESGEQYYREAHGEYTISKYIAGPISVELSGKHRVRREDLQNVRNLQGISEYWRQGEHYTAVKVAPKWVFTQGIEYTTQLGFPTMYYNGAVLYRFTSDSSLRVFVGQQRGGLRCVSGICKIFPAFEGARAELTLRF